MKIIAVDIGNSSINIGFFTEHSLIVQSIRTQPLAHSLEYKERIEKFLQEKNMEKQFDGLIISSVVPECTAAVSEALKTLSKKEPVILTHKLNTGIALDVTKPESAGTDRIAACAGACVLYEPPLVVIDFGTATTLNFVGKGNVYKGGAILPGIGMMKHALFSETAQLPEIEITKPNLPPGRDTQEAILIGIIYGTAGAVERIITETEKAENETYLVVITGGSSRIAAQFLKRVDYIEPDIVLKGLKSIYERNCECMN